MSSTTETLDNAALEERFEKMVGRLSKLSVDKHFDAFADVPWDDPEMQIDPTDSRWELWDIDPIGRTSWYRSQPPDVRARVGLCRVAQALHTGWQFENILQIGLLIHAMGQSKESRQFRYLHHEIAEESQHSMMFHEFVRRAGVTTSGMPRVVNLVVRPGLMFLSRWEPIVLALAALAGEEPVDHLQRSQLEIGFRHPLIERITRIHVTEEARHISFARHYVRRTAPKLGRLRRLGLSIAIPIAMWFGALLMVHPGSGFARAAGVPRSVVREAWRSREYRQLFADSVQKIRDLAYEVELANPVARGLWWLLFDRPIARAPELG